MHISLHAMHIPDGFLSLLVSVLFWLASITAISMSIKRLSKERDDRLLPIMGVLAAAIFAGQMLNFAVAGGTSGHLLGATLATILVGPWAGMLVMTSVVVIQAVIFQDGGLLAMGANLFNMAVIGCSVSYLVYSFFRRVSGNKKWGILAGAGMAAWVSIVFSSLAAGLELALSGTSPANIAVPAMAGIHALIGIGEALITLGATTYVLSARPDLLSPNRQNIHGSIAIWLAGSLLAILLAILSPLASAHPDGLESVAAKLGFLHQAKPASFSILPEYLVPGISNENLGTILAGLIGVVMILIATLTIYIIRRPRSK